MVVLIYHMRRVDCRACGVRIETVPWGVGKHQLTKPYMLFLAHWARKLSWTETATSFHSTWEKVCQSVEYVVQWGLEHRQLGPIEAIGVDEIQYARGHKYLTLVYQIEHGCTRLLWIGRERTKESFDEFFTMIGEELTGKIQFVCSDMWPFSYPHLWTWAITFSRSLRIEPIVNFESRLREWITKRIERRGDVKSSFV